MEDKLICLKQLTQHNRPSLGKDADQHERLVGSLYAPGNKLAMLSNKPDPSVQLTSGLMRFSGRGIKPSALKFLE
jgi:hypothetical protein